MNLYGKLILALAILLMGIWQICWITDMFQHYDFLSAIGAGFFAGWGVRSIVAGLEPKNKN